MSVVGGQCANGLDHAVQVVEQPRDGRSLRTVVERDLKVLRGEVVFLGVLQRGGPDGVNRNLVER